MKEIQHLFEAAQQGDAASVRLFQANGISPNSLNEKGYSLLSESVKHKKTVQQLINATNNLGNNALQAIADLPLAEERTHEYLIEHGIDLHHRNKAGQTAFDLAKAHDNKSLMQLLISHEAD